MWSEFRLQHFYADKQLKKKLKSGFGLEIYRKNSSFIYISEFLSESWKLVNMSGRSYNEEDGTLKMYLRGRPVIFDAPSDIAQDFNISKTQTAPKKELKLDWVYGYRGKDCRSNLFLLQNGEIVYFVAAAVILHNPEEQTQRHYLEHTDDVMSLALHPNRLIIATGQCAGHNRKDALSHIRVWNPETLETITVLGYGEFNGPINCISFSHGEEISLITATEDSPDRMISVWDWQKGDKGLKLTETRCSRDAIVAVEFHPQDHNQIITVGKKHVGFWTYDETLEKRNGIFGNNDIPKCVICIAFNENGDVLTGDSNGDIIVWGRGTNTIATIIKNVHEGSIFSLCSLENGSLISGGGKDGQLVLFDSNLTQTDTKGSIESQFGAVRVVTKGKDSQLLVGTTRNCIMIGSLEDGFSPFVMGHTAELWGLAVHPTMAQFVTGGNDHLLQMWDSPSHSVVWSKDIGEGIQSCAFSPDGELIAVGGLTGHWMVFDAASRDLLFEATDGPEPIQVIKFSPDGQYIALGSRDNFIYVYAVNEDKSFTQVGSCSGHSSYITHLDWSEDGEVIRSNSGDYEVLYWNGKTCEQITASSSLRDVKWATNSCTLSFNTVGIWPEYADGTDINAAGRSNDKMLVVSGDDYGKVNLYRYPAAHPKSVPHTYGGHSSHVTSVEFLHDDSQVISIGGNDTSVMQWAVV